MLAAQTIYIHIVCSLSIKLIMFLLRHPLLPGANPRISRLLDFSEAQYILLTEKQTTTPFAEEEICQLISCINQLA